MIHREAVPVGHTSPYKRIEIAHLGRKTIITADELALSGDREPDPAAYRYDVDLRAYLLKARYG
ncbi:hypothetical protein HAP48_0004625 [Bradyrhizobium septentrionale]|uniref:Uncharacterized protein n=1 Tax=Bradyrhizobium septentrionale TaxID=1404411 RepID=A0A974A4X3_9BRAD|nr:MULTISPECIES: hypothetical protein [Bradyrhizobium]MCK7664636.1 hypothetical protein [Bradyrhizobium sp. 2S1]MCK7666186.1 hypothetical protein [Bradyrhizobium sp. 2S1]UGY16822.1 hypothetical protein HAP48_0004625 [Bradyrhizobium septentrionale]UGY25422.1 hypothetical protein HU675_0000170 [Bradyrhizobium septentrionale]